MATLLLGLGLSPVSTSPAQAAGGSATDWMHQAKFGVMEHYLAEGCPMRCDWPNNMPTAQQWKDRVAGYDVEGVAQQVKATGAGWMQLSVGQNTGYWAAPNSTYDQLVPPTASHPSRLAERDLIKDLGAALHARGLKFIVYITSDAMELDDYARTQLGGPGQAKGKPNAQYQANWLKIIQTWATQWGTNVDGFWVDGAYFSDLQPFYDQMAGVLRSGNPDAILSFNPTYGATGSYSTQSDFTAGETHPTNWPEGATGRWWKNGDVQMQLHRLAISQTYWGENPSAPMSYTTEDLIRHTQKVTDIGGAVTWDVGYDRTNGHISAAAMNQLTALGKALGKLPPSIKGVGSGKCVDVPASNTQNGTDLIIQTCHYGANQQWTFNPANGEVRSLGKCMDVDGGNPADHTAVQLWECNGSDAQKWHYDASSRQLKALGKCLDAYGAGTADLTRLIIDTCHAGTNQQWQLI